MPTDVFEKRVRLGATVLLVLVGAEMLRYTYVSFRRAYRFSFGEPDRWNTHWSVDAGTVVETTQRATYFSIWTVVILASIAASISALILLNRLRKSQMFEESAARGVQWIGGLVVLAMVLDTGFGAVDLWMITQQNADGPSPIQYRYDPSDLKATLLGMVIFLFGWVMHDAISIARENSEFV